MPHILILKCLTLENMFYMKYDRERGILNIEFEIALANIHENGIINLFCFYAGKLFFFLIKFII